MVIEEFILGLFDMCYNLEWFFYMLVLGGNGGFHLFQKTYWYHNFAIVIYPFIITFHLPCLCFVLIPLLFLLFIIFSLFAICRFILSQLYFIILPILASVLESISSGSNMKFIVLIGSYRTLLLKKSPVELYSQNRSPVKYFSWYQIASTALFTIFSNLS